MKTAVVTGASSFVGCHLAKEFAWKGWAVTATLSKSRNAYDGIQAERLKWIGEAVSWQVLDIRDEKAVRAFIARVRPELWVHHAGYTVNYGNPDYDLRAGRATNVEPLHYIYEELARAGNSGMIVTGSSMEYSDTDQAYRESDECKPSTPYGRSKLEETDLAKELSKRHGVPTRVARLFIPFGPLDASAKVLPYVIENLRKENAVDLSPCTQRRDFLYIEDVANAYGLLAEDLKRGGFDVFNICSGEAVAVRSLIEKIADRLGASRGLLGFGKRAIRPGEQPISYGSCERAKQVLGWHPGALDEGIAEFLRVETESAAGAPPPARANQAMTVRVFAGITLLVMVSLFSTVKLTKPMDQFAYKFAGITEIVPDGVTLYEARFAKLRLLLPRYGTVGYVADNAGPRDIAAHEKYLYVRYALAPVLVENSPRYALVVGNITQPATDLQQFLHDKNLVLMKDFGDGVLLLHGRER